MRSYRDKVLAREALLEQAARWRAAGERVVLANGCFDLLHAGHVRYLRAAAALGGRLVVAVNSDASTRQLKGEGRPLLDQGARAELVAAVAGVAAVTVFEEMSVEALLRRLRPDVHAKGTDYTAATVPEAATAQELGVAVRIVGDAKRHSTQTLVARMRGEAG